MRVLVSGARGMIGRALVPALEARGHAVTRLTRSRPRDAREFRWDPGAGLVDPAAVAGCDAVVHLAGSSMAGGRWSAARRAEIMESRRIGTRLIAGAIARSRPRPLVLISASAIGYYGDRGDEALDETSGPGAGFLAEVVRAWEAETEPAAEAGARVVRLRFGLVLDLRGGALPPLLLPFRFGVGGPLGSGRQWVSWITLRDAVRSIAYALSHNELEGALNAVSPGPVSQRELARTIGRVLARPAFGRVPGWLIRTVLGQMGEELLLYSQRVVPVRLAAAGFTFDDPALEAALRDILGRHRAAD